MDEREIFLQVIQVNDPAAREELLRRATANDASLRHRVESLLEVHDRAGGFLESPPANICATIDQPGTECVGTLIGPYKLLEQIGEGGMGLVYMAEQQRPMRRLVALKLIKPGMDSKQVIARFEAEKQALAMMDHENIAKVFEAGTTDTGRFYFAMELVRGIPINEFCDQKRLSVRERLALFIQVCQAVQHAHQKGIIHRDLKPSNVLVTMNDVLAVPKVIDFGIAKALGQQLTEHTLHTGFAQLVGTPLYMSPEQAEMNQLGVDTRSDVYSLGVLLYELLTGTTPFDKETLSKAGLDEMRRMIREDDPLRPSARMSTLQAPALSTISQRRSTDPRRISATLRGELDWIVMKALEKDRSRRYESASALATDIQRYLSDEPVLACPPTAMYRFQKFARKHKPALATAAAIAACLILGTTVSGWQAARAVQAEAQASANEAQAKEAAAAEAQQRQRAEANEQKAVANAVTAQEKEQEAIKQRDEVKALAEKLVAKEQQLERTLYAAHMNLAHNAFEAGAPGRLRELLAQHHPQPGEADLRGFEWHYLNGLFPVDLLVLEHAGLVRSVAYSPDGKRLATTSRNGTSRDSTLSVWDAQTGHKVFSHAGINGNATATFSPDGKRVASQAVGRTKIWDAETGQELFWSENVATLPTFSPDGKRLATGSVLGPMAMWDAQTGERLLPVEGHSAYIWCLGFSPDGNRLASASEDKTVKLWDAQSGQALHTLQHADSVYGVAFSPDGKRLASASADKTVKLWDALSGNEIRTLAGHTGAVRSVTFSPDGKRLASASDDSTVKVWDVESEQELFALSGHASGVRSVAFSPDGKRLASASEDGTVKVREAKAVQKALVLGGGATNVTKVAFSPDGKRLTSVDERGPAPGVYEAKIWDTQTGEKLLTLDAGNVAAALSLDGRRLAGGSHRLDGRVIIVEGRERRTIAFEANIWDLLSGEKLLTIPNVWSSRNFALSPDGSRLAIIRGPLVTFGGKVHDAKTGQLWDAKNGEEIRSLTGPVNNVVCSPDGKRMAGIAEDKTLKLWDAQTGDEILTLKGAAGSVAFSHDGKRVASGSDDATVAKVWDAKTGEELLSLKGHSGAITGVAFSPDNKRLATTSSDATIKVWDSQTGQELLTLAGHGFRDNGIAFSPDGNRLAVGGPNGTVLIYDATPLPEKP